MNGNQRLRRLTRSGWGILGGVIAIGAAAAAAGAAPSTVTPWSSHEPTATSSSTASTPPPTAASTSTPTITIGHEPVTDGHSASVAASEPATTHPAATEPATTAPATTAPASTEPASTVALSSNHEPAITTATAPSTTAAAPDPAPAPVPPPSPAPAAPVSDNVVPAGLSLSCSASTSESGTDVSCEWSGPIPAAFAKFVLLRGNQPATGRVPFQSADPSAHQFVDVALAPGSYTYVVVALDAAGKPLVHSNMVAITSPG